MAYESGPAIYEDLTLRKGSTWSWSFDLYPLDLTGGVVTFRVQDTYNQLDAGGIVADDVIGPQASNTWGCFLTVSNPGTPNATTTVTIKLLADFWSGPALMFDYFVRAAVNGDTINLGRGKITIIDDWLAGTIP